jgi:hypothetical protein
MLALDLRISVLLAAACATARPAGDAYFDYTYNLPEASFAQANGFTDVLLDDDGAGFSANPAALGLAARSWQTGALATTYSSLFPTLNLPGFYEFSESFALQKKAAAYAYGGALTVKSHGLITGKSGTEYGLSLGRRFAAQSLGLSLKFVTSKGVRPPTLNGDGTVSESGPDVNDGYLLDVGYLGSFGGHFLLGACARNLGRGVTGVRPRFHRHDTFATTSVSLAMENDALFSLTPPSLSLGAGTHFNWDAPGLRVLSTALAVGWTVESNEGGEVGRFLDGEVEAGIFNVLTVRTGTMQEADASGNIVKLGAGLNLFNHVSLGYARIESGEDVSDGQKSFSLLLYNLFKWEKGDLAWWRKKEPALP